MQHLAPGQLFLVVSIHAPPEGRDRNTWRPGSCFLSFQSTRPRRGAIPVPAPPPHPRHCFNPRAPGGARYLVAVPVIADSWVSIHAPPEGRDPCHATGDITHPCFNPRAPGGARSSPGLRAHTGCRVSIHAPPEGRDKFFPVILLGT